MRIIELGCEIVKQVVQVIVELQMNPNHVLQRTGDKKILLLESQLLALKLFIIGIEHLGYGFRFYLVFHSSVIVTLIEVIKIKGLVGLRAPQAQQIDVIYLIAGYGGIIGYSSHSPSRNPANSPESVIGDICLSVTAEPHVTAEIRFFYLPGIAWMQPSITDLLLPAVNNFLIENPVFIADSI